MPSGKTHDAITILLAAPVFAGSYVITLSLFMSGVLGAAFVIGGLMFGPDLDTVSRQYSRWWIFKGIWFPYRTFFRHRSRWSHGLIFGTLIRVGYFVGAVTLGGFLAAFATEIVSGTQIANAADFFLTWRQIGQYFHDHVGWNFGVAGFLGLWLGAASHTFADIAGSYIKTGKAKGFL